MTSLNEILHEKAGSPLFTIDQGVSVLDAVQMMNECSVGALIVTNVFGFRSTDPLLLKKEKDPVGPGNDAAILRAAREAAIVVCAWGNHGAQGERSRKVLELLQTQNIRLHALRVNANGEPAHPLYLPGALTPSAWAVPSAP